MHVRPICLLLLLAALAVHSSGCLAVAAGAGAAGTVAYMRGNLEIEEPYTIQQTYTAAREAVQELGLRIIEAETGQDALSARVTARDSADKRIEIRLKAITSNATTLSVRVGTFGDKTKTHRIYNTIREHLRETAAVAAAPAPDPPPPTAE
jgi:hypothetical protein